MLEMEWNLQYDNQRLTSWSIEKFKVVILIMMYVYDLYQYQIWKKLFKYFTKIKNKVMITPPGCGFITFPRDRVSRTHSLKPQSIINPQSESCQHSSGQSRGPEAAGVQTARTPTFILILMFMLRHMKYCCLISTSPNIATQINNMPYFRNKTLKRKMKGKHWPGSTLEE